MFKQDYLGEIAMKKLLSVSALVLSSTVLSNAVSAQPEILEDAYVGGGVSHNNLDFGSVVDGASDETANGFQIFVGKKFDNDISGFDTAVEIGYSQTEDFKWGPGAKDDVKGLWASAIMTRDLDEVSDKLYGFGRLGFNLGDDDGLMMGVGAGYELNDQVDLRAEFLNQDLVTSYQLSAIYKF